MTNKVLVDDGARWILQGDEQDRENRTAGVKALYSMPAVTTSGRAKELVKQGVSERNGNDRVWKDTRAIRQDCWSGEALGRVSVPSGHPPDSLEDKWLRWQRLMRPSNMTSLDDDAREKLTIAGLEKAKERALEQHLRLRAPQTWTVLRASVDQCLSDDGGLGQSAHANGNWCRDVNVCLLWQSWTRESEMSTPQCVVQQLRQDRTSQSDVLAT